MKKNGKNWRRPGVRVNMYFESRAVLRRLDKLAKKARKSRSEFVADLVLEQTPIVYTGKPSLLWPDLVRYP